MTTPGHAAADDDRRWLICPGLARAATTYLYRAFADPANATHFQVSRKKEVHWLERGTPETVERMYGTPRPGAWHLDISPGYSRFPTAFAKVIQSLPIDGRRKFVVSLRDPIDQAYAHYLHDLKEHVAFEDRADRAYPFLGDEAARTYFPDKSRLFRRIRDRFGAENVLFLNFHTMFDDLPALGARIGEFLGLPPLAMPDQAANVGGWMPRFVYGGVDGVTVEHGAILLTIPPRALALINGPRSRIIEEAAPAVVSAALGGAATWLSHLNRAMIARLDEALQPAIDGYSELLGEPIGRYRPPQLRAGLAPLSPTVASALRAGRSLTDRLVEVRSMAAAI